MKNNHDEVTKNEVKSPITTLNGNGTLDTDIHKDSHIDNRIDTPRISYTLEVMRIIWGYQKPITVKLIKNMTGYSERRVLKCLEYLSRFRAVTKEYYTEKERYHDPPHKYLLVSLNKSQKKMAWRYLMKNGLL